MKIAICDDSVEDITRLNSLIEEKLKTKNNIEIEAYNSGEELLEACVSETFDIVFLDVKMEGMIGTDVCRKIREKNEGIYIVLTTSFIEYSQDGYDVGASQFIMKPCSEERVEKILNQYFDIIKKERKLTINNKGETVLIHLKDLMYIETEKKVNTNSNLIFVLCNERIRTKGKITDYEEELEKYKFIRIHKSIIVNYEYIKSLRYGEMILIDDTVLPISRSYQSYIKEKINKMAFTV